MSDYWKKKLDELEKSTEKAAPSTSYWQSKLNELEEEEKTKEEKKIKEEEQKSSSFKKDDRTWLQKGALKDGITVGNIAKAILGTRQDIGTNLAAGILGLGETITDTAAYVSAATALPNTMRAAQGEYYRRKVLGEEPMTTDEMVSKYYALNTNLERAASRFISQDLYNEEEVAKKLIAPTATAQRLLGVDAEADSILGERADSLVQSGGQLLATTALSAAGVPWWLVSGTSAFGGQAEQALNENASFREAGASAAISAAAEVLSEKLSGGIKFGGKTLDDALLKPLTERIASKGWKFLTNVAKDAAGEGLEEVFSSAISNLGKKIYKDESVKELLFNEQALDEYLEGFFGGAILGGIGGVKNAQTTDVEQQVITHEYNKRVEAEKAEGKKLTVKDLSKIYNEVDEDVENGRISVDTIEEALGGEDYKNYKSELEGEKANKEEYLKLYKMKSGDKSDADIERQAELKKLLGEGTKSTEIKSKVSDNVFKQVTGTRLLESYNERERKSQKYEADVSKYDEGQRKVIQSAIDSGILNNTTQTHRFVDMIAKISADKGVSFDFTDNKKIKGTRFAVEGRQVNGYITEDGTVTLNINSAKALNTIVGHEITHVLEGTELYGELRSVLFEYAKSKKDYQSRYDNLVKTYEGVEGTDIDAELTADLVGDYLFSDKDFINRLSTEHRNIFQKIYDEIKYLARVATAGSKEARELERIKKMFEDEYRESGKVSAETTVESELNEIHLEYDAESETVSYSLSSLEEAFDLKKGAIAESMELDGNYKAAEDYIKAREEYANALAKSIALDKNNITDEEYAKANNYLDGLFLIGEMIAKDTDRLDYEAAVDKSSWVRNSEYGGSIDFSTLCAKRRLFTGTFDAIQNLLPDTVLNENDFLQIRNMLLEKDLESPCSMCYVEGSRAKHGEYVAKFLKEYLATNPEWKPQIADFTSSVRLEQTRINHPEAYEAYTHAMDKLAQRKPKEASVRTDYKGEILVAFEDGSSVEIKNQNGGIRFNSFSDFEIIHALDCMQVITDMARVGLNGQAYTKVAEFAEAFGNTGLKINLSLVAKDVDANGKLVFDEVNGMKYSEAMRLRNAYSENVGTVIVAFNEAQVRAALADNTIDYVLPFHRSQWKKSQYTMMGLPSVTKDFTMQQNDRIKNPKTGRPVKLSKLKQTTTYTNDITGESFKIQDNIMPNQYWDWNVSGRENAQRYLDYINSNGMTPKFDFLLEKADGKWTLPEGAVGDGYYKLLIDFKMYNNDGWGAPQKPVLPEFNMGFIQKMLNDYTGGHQAFPVAHDVVDEFVKSKQGVKRSLSMDAERSESKSRGSVYGEGISYAPVKEPIPVRAKAKSNAEVTPVYDPISEEIAEEVAYVAEDIAPTRNNLAPVEKHEAIRPKSEAKTEKQPRMIRADNAESDSRGKQRKWVGTSTESDAVDGKILPDDLDQSAIHYQPISNAKTLGNANAKLNSLGYKDSVTYFNGQFENKNISLDDIALGERLIQEAVKKGDYKTAGELITDISILGTELGQKVQALSIIKRLTPEGQIRAIQRTIERGKTKGDKAFDGVKLTQEMIDKILGVYAKASDEILEKLQREIANLDGAELTKTDAFWVTGDTYKHRDKLKELGFKWSKENKAWYLMDASGKFDQNELNKVVEEVKQDIAKQMKVTAMEKVNAWRYLSMLGNPKTHIRNLVSNIAMRGTVAVKNVVARSIETGVTGAAKGAEWVANKITGKENHFDAPIKNRTKTFRMASADVKNFANQKTIEMQDIISGDSKYSDSASIKSKRATFKIKILNGVYEFNSNLLSKEDWWFSRPAFKNSLSEYLTANGIRTQQDINSKPELVEKAIQYALEQSQIATFRQYSWLANKINDIERKNAATEIAVGAILPFKKTPVNIAKTGLSYSPLGFAKTLTYDIAQVKKGNMEASTLIDHLAQNVTGSALALVGYMLAQSGFLNGAGDDDKEGKYDYQLGKQAYSINIGGATFSLSWLSPVAMPLFVGANAYEQLVEKKEWNGDVVIQTLAQTLDPLSEMSFLSSLDSVLSSYDSGIQKFAGIGETMVQNYVTQFVPTFMSQVATVLDDTKRTTKVGADSGFELFDETINNLAYKIPFLRETLEPSTDIWGNEVKQTENIFARAFETFIAPYAKKEDIGTEIDGEIKALYGKTGDTGLIPSVPYNYVNYDDTKYEMSEEEYTEYKKIYGQTAYNLLEDLFDTDTYKNATSEERADMVNRVYDYARDEAKRELLAGRGVEYTNAESKGKKFYREDYIKGAIENDVTVEEYKFSVDNPKKYKFLNDNGVTYDDYNASEETKEAYTWAFDNPDKYVLSKAAASDVVTYRQYASELYKIKADKDANGKSISGSRKSKVLDYINGLDADYGEKIILYKSEYPSDDTYNYDIIDYLNGRDDISYEEMKTILIELGFTVSADGSVTW